MQVVMSSNPTFAPTFFKIVKNPMCWASLLKGEFEIIHEGSVRIIVRRLNTLFSISYAFGIIDNLPLVLYP